MNQGFTWDGVSQVVACWPAKHVKEFKVCTEDNSFTEWSLFWCCAPCCTQETTPRSIVVPACVDAVIVNLSLQVTLKPEQ